MLTLKRKEFSWVSFKIPIDFSLIVFIQILVILGANYKVLPYKINSNLEPTIRRKDFENLTNYQTIDGAFQNFS